MPKIAVITDLHWPSVTERAGFIRYGDHALSVLDTFFRAAKNEYVDLSVNLGDTIASRCSAGDKSTIHKKMKDSPVDLFHIAGNNEFKANKGAFLPDASGFLLESSSFDIGGLHLVFFRPNVNITGLSLPDITDDLKWLSSDLDKTDNPAIVFSHVPLFRPKCDLEYSINYPPPESLLYYPNQAELSALFRSHSNVIGLVSGHLHREVLETHEDGYFCLGLPSATQGRKTGPDCAFGILDFNLQEERLIIHRYGRKAYTKALSFRTKDALLSAPAFN